MSKINHGGPAFPVQDQQAIHAVAAAAIMGIEDSDERDAAYTKARAQAVGGMTLRQYAAIKLRVPDSGTDWLDEMIRKSVRDELAARAMQGFAAAENPGWKSMDHIAETAYEWADAMLRAKEAA